MAQINFRFQGKRVHLTYRSHLPKDDLRELFNSIGGGLKFYSICHEQGHAGAQQQGVEPTDQEAEDDQIPYPHTHAFFHWNRTVDSHSARYFDIIVDAAGGISRGNGGGVPAGDRIHPHIKRVTTDLHASRICREYHVKEDGEPLQSTELPGGTDDVQRILDARDDVEAVRRSGVEIRTVSDVLQLRHRATTVRSQPQIYPNYNWAFKCNFGRVLYLWGPSGFGKTQWAIHQFENPLLVSTLDELGNFSEGVHDGIVFDDFDVSVLDRETLIHLLDWDERRTIRIRYKDAIIPAGTRKVFTSNKCPHDASCYFDDPAVLRRVSRIVRLADPAYRAEDAPTGEELALPRAEVWKRNRTDAELGEGPEAEEAEGDLPAGTIGFDSLPALAEDPPHGRVGTQSSTNSPRARTNSRRRLGGNPGGVDNTPLHSIDTYAQNSAFDEVPELELPFTWEQLVEPDVMWIDEF